MDLEQSTQRSRILGGDDIGTCQHVQGTQGDVSGGANRSRHKVETRGQPFDFIIQRWTLRRARLLFASLGATNPAGQAAKPHIPRRLGMRIVLWVPLLSFVAAL